MGIAVTPDGAFAYVAKLRDTRCSVTAASR